MTDLTECEVDGTTAAALIIAFYCRSRRLIYTASAELSVYWGALY